MNLKNIIVVATILLISKFDIMYSANNNQINFDLETLDGNGQNWNIPNTLDKSIEELIEKEISKQVTLVHNELGKKIDQFIERLRFDLNASSTQYPQNFERMSFHQETLYLKRSDNYDVALIEEALISCPEKLRFILELIRGKNKFDDFFKIFIQNNIVLVGPPGVGKSLLAESIALYCNIPYTFIKATSLANEYINSGASNLNRIFEPLLALDEPHIIIIDELQTIIKKHNGRDIDASIAEALWLLLDQCKVKKNIFIIATANDIASLPPQLKSRLSKNIYEIALPQLKARERIITYYISKITFPHSITSKVIQEIAKKTYGFSARDLESVIDIAISNVPLALVEKGYLDFSIKDLYFGIYTIKKNRADLGFIPEWFYRTFEYMLPTIIMPFATTAISLLVSSYFTYQYNQSSLNMNEAHHREVMNLNNFR